MSNTFAPFGLRPAQRNDGVSPNYALQTRPIYYTDSNNIGLGDPVKTVSSGANQGTLDIASTNSQVAGVFWGVSYVDNVLGQVWRPSWTGPSTAVVNTVSANYIPDAGMVYEIQAGNSSAAIGQTSIGLNAAFASTSLGVPTTTSGISKAYLDASTIATTNTLPMRIVGFSTGFFNQAQNDPTSAYPVLLVTLNNLDATNTTGV